MIIESVELKDFRNYREAKVELDEGTNILYGDNAQGKTNLLESLYMSGTSRSFRGSRDRDMIRFGGQEGHIRTVVKKSAGRYQIDIHLKKNKTKGIAVNRIPIKRASELFGIADFVLFSPEDLYIIKQGPAQRRRFIDTELCQLDKVYYHFLWDYNHALYQRNQLLKDIVYNPSLLDTLDVWDMQLANCGRKIIKEREKFVSSLEKIIKEIHLHLSGGRESLEIAYEKNADADFLYEKIKEGRDRDLKVKTSTVGPHRDDLYFAVDDVDIRRFGSQGQQRTAALSLKLSEIEIVRRETGENPVLLLDDVLSELDQNRQKFLLKNIEDVQTIITCTGIDEFVKERFAIDRIFFVSEGKITEKKDSAEGK